MNDPYAVLGVPRDATPSAVRKTYRRLVRDCHPDLLVGCDPWTVRRGAERFRVLTEALEVLCDDAARARLDATLPRYDGGFVPGLGNGSSLGAFFASAAPTFVYGTPSPPRVFLGSQHGPPTRFERTLFPAA